MRYLHPQKSDKVEKGGVNEQKRVGAGQLGSRGAVTQESGGVVGIFEKSRGNGACHPLGCETWYFTSNLWWGIK